MGAEQFVRLKKDDHKLFTFLGNSIAFIIATIIAYLLARAKKSSPYIPAIVLVCTEFGAMGGHFLAKKLKEKKTSYQDDFVKKKESKFNYNYNFEVTTFGGILAIIYSYLAIYLSEVLNLVKDFQLNDPTSNFSEVFVDVAKNIFLVDWAREYLIEYWIFLTFFVIVMIVSVIWASKKIKKMEQEEKEKKENTKSKFQ